MKKLLVILLSILSFNISSAQSGWGYVNYTSYKTHNGNGDQSQYNAFANDAAGFDAMFNTTNSNTTITHTGETQIVNLYNGSSQVPRWNNDYFGYKFEFFFVPQQTGTYYFGINSDDASDLSMDGTVIVSYYGGHGASSWQTVPKNLVAGQKYRMVYRGQEFGGGEAFYFMWYRPVGGWGYWNNEVTNIGIEPTKKARMNFDFGSTLNRTTFAIGSALSSTGWVDITNSLDSNKIGNGYKANLVGGQVEYAYVTNYTDTTMLLNLDLRTFGNTPHADVKSIKLLDAYEGSIKYVNSNIYWVVYTIPKQTFTPGTYVRDMGAGSYAFKCDISYSNLEVYKPQSVTMTTTNTLTTLYNSIVTVSDVYLAFKELANGGIFGNQTGNEFVYGIQYKNADVNDDDVFNEADCFRLLQHLTGAKNIVDTFNLNKILKLIPQSTYNTIGKSNWTTFPSYLGNAYNFDINTGKATDTFYIKGTWKGDVNLSHSATPPSNNITTMAVRLTSTSIPNIINASIITELSDKVYAYITLDPLQQEVVGTQFQLNYDNTVLKFENVEFKTKGNPMNYSTNKNDYINLGSLISDGSTTLDNTTTYKVTFTPLNKLDNTLGLISIGATDAVNRAGTQLKVKIN